MQAFLWLQQAGARLHCSARASHCDGISCCETQPLHTGPAALVACGPSSCGSQTLDHRLNHCARGQLLCGMWDLPRPGIEPRLLQGQVDSLPLNHQESPAVPVLTAKTLPNFPSPRHLSLPKTLDAALCLHS